jgi:hypothetical protein
MEREFIRLDDSFNAERRIYASPEEYQADAKVLAPDLPDGWYRDVVSGRTKDGRPTLTIGPVRVGQRLTLDDGTGAAALPPTAPAAALVVPDTVKAATDEQLEVMAVRNMGKLPAKWRGWNRAVREATVARALVKQNAA